MCSINDFKYCVGGTSSAQVFAASSDIDGHWAQQQILTFAENGYIAGDGTGNYLPNQIMTRAQFAAVINRVMGYTEESPSIANYTDVEDSAWYRSDLAKALSAGYMSGTSATTMSPNQPVTREQAAVMIVRLLEENTSVDLSVLDDFTDRGDISAFAVNAMAKLISDGYLYGADGKLMPQKSMTRAEGIALLSRSMDALKNTNLEEEKEETKTEEKTIPIKEVLEAAAAVAAAAVAVVAAAVAVVAPNLLRISLKLHRRNW